MSYDPTRIPPRSMEVLRKWKQQAQYWPHGHFFEAFLSGRLLAALLRADEENFEAFQHMVIWCHTQLPAGSWGTSENYDAWMQGAKNKYKASEEAIGHVSER